MKTIYLLFYIVISSSLFANEIQSYLKTATRLLCDGLQNYEVVYSPSYLEFEYSPSDPHSYLQDPYYIIKSVGESGYVILDSIRTRFVCAGDTNVIIFESRDDSLSYFVAITLSPQIIYDTLIALENDDNQNWISSIWMYLRFSIRDSVLIYDDTTSNNKDCRIIKILPDNNWKELVSFGNIRNFHMLWDYSKFLICTHYPYNKKDYPAYRLFEFNLGLDSLYEREDLEGKIMRAIQYYEDSSLYFLQCIGKNCNVWELKPDGEKVNLTNQKPPYYVFEFGLRGTDLHYKVWKRGNRDYEKPYWIKLED